MFEDLLRLEQHPNEALIIYDKEPAAPAAILDDIGAIAVIERGDHIIVPTHHRGNYTVEMIDDLIIGLIVAMVPEWKPYEDDPEKAPIELQAMIDIEKWDVHFGRLLSHDDHRLIPEGHFVGLCEPEFLGRFVVQEEGRFGLAIHNPRGVVGYREVPFVPPQVREKVRWKQLRSSRSPT